MGPFDFTGRTAEDQAGGLEFLMVIMVIDDFIKKLLAAAAPLSAKSIQSAARAHEARLKALEQIHSGYLARLNSPGHAEAPLHGFLRETQTFVENYLTWTKSLQTSDDVPSDSFNDEWTERFLASLEEVPGEMDIPIPAGYWAATPEDSDRVRLWKSWKRKSLAVRNYRLGITNRIRLTLGRAALPPVPDHRHVPVHDFLRYFLFLPVSRFLLREREALFRVTALQLQHLHQTTNEMLQGLLSLEDTDEETAVPAASQSDRIRLKLKQIQEKDLDIPKSLSDLRHYVDESSKRFGHFAEETTKSLHRTWNDAGLFALPHRRFDQDQSEERQRSLDKEAERAGKAWNLLFQGEQGDWGKDLELLQLEIQAGLVCMETQRSIDQKIRDQILAASIEPARMISESLQRFQDESLEAEGRLEEMLLNENRSFVRSLRREKIPGMLDAVDRAQIEKSLENFFLRIKHTAENQPDKHVILYRQNLDSPAPDIQIMEIPLKDLIIEEFVPELSVLHAGFTDLAEQRLQEIRRDISELDKIVEFNLEAALEILQRPDQSDDGGNARSVVIEGLGRAAGQLGNLVGKTEAVMEECDRALPEMTNRYRKRLQDLADNEKIVELKIRVARAKAKERVRSYQTLALERMRKAVPSLLGAWEISRKKVWNAYLWLRRVTGFQAAAVEADKTLPEIITESQNRIGKVPHVYRRLFRIEPLSDERFFEGRTQEVAVLKEEFDAWRAGHHEVTAVVGEKGSGRTTLMNYVSQKLYNVMPVRRFNFQELGTRTEDSLLAILKKGFNEETITDLDGLETRIKETDGRQVAIVEDLQCVFLRTADGFETLERFLLFVSRTCGRIYWVITCSLYNWQYLDRVIQVSKYFQNTVFLGQLSEEDLENIILKRHRISGYKLQFELPKEEAASPKLKKRAGTDDPQVFLRDTLLAQLTGLSSGNITVAMLLWLSAIKRVEQDTFAMASQVDFNYSSVFRLSSEELFTLAALLQHEALNAEEHAAIFHQEMRQSWLLLNRMANQGVLVERTTGFYAINPLVYRPVVKALKMKNILHWG